jgi:hypothetical protein
MWRGNIRYVLIHMSTSDYLPVPFNRFFFLPRLRLWHCYWKAASVCNDRPTLNTIRLPWPVFIDLNDERWVMATDARCGWALKKDFGEL